MAPHESSANSAAANYDLYTRQHGLETNLFLVPGEGDKIEEPQTSKV